MSLLRSKGAIADHIELMAAALPDNPPSFLKRFTLESAFSDLAEGIRAVGSQLNGDVFASCEQLLVEAKTAYERGDHELGREALYSLLGTLEGKTYRGLGSTQ